MRLKNKFIFISVLLILALVSFQTMDASAKELAKEQIFRIGIGSNDLSSLDPIQASQLQDAPVVYHLFDGLVRFPVDKVTPRDFEPGLAERWEQSKDGLSYTFHLRKGVKWHRGYGEFTSLDVKFSLERAKNSKASMWAVNYKGIKDIKILDKYTVRIDLAGPDPFFLSAVANFHGGLIVCKKAVEAANAFERKLTPVKEELIGTGPFMFESYESKNRTVLVRNDEYFLGKPIIERIEYYYVPELSTRELALRRGELDATEGAGEKEWVEKMEKAGFTVDPMGPPDLKMLQFNMTRKPLDDIRVRRAIAHAINRQAFVDFAGDKICKIPLSPIPSTYYGRVTEGLPQYEYNPEKARKLLTEAGYPNGFSMEMWITTMPVYLDKMVIVQSHLRKVGIDLKLKKVAHTVYHPHSRKDLNPMVLIGARRFPVAQIWLHQFHYGPSTVLKPKAVRNYSHYDGIDAFIEKAAVELDREKQLALYREAQIKLMEDLPSYPLAESYKVYARARYVDLGYKPISNLSQNYNVATYTKIFKR